MVNSSCSRPCPVKAPPRSLMSFTADPAFPAELDRLMRINTGIMRSIIVSKEG